MPDAEYLKYFRTLQTDARFVVVSNREPWMHEQISHRLKVTKPASGMVAGIEPIIRALGGTWVAHGSAPADRLAVDEKDHVFLPPNSREYMLRRVWLTRREEEGYYYGISNRALWPLCHMAYTRPAFSQTDWNIYRDVNKRFCDAVLEEIGQDKAIVFIQDYHLALLPRLLKDRRPELRIVLFWHIPWPDPEVFRIFPWGQELLEGMLGANILGFHIRHHCDNFLTTVEPLTKTEVDYGMSQVCSNGGHITHIRAYPISVDYQQIVHDAVSPEVVRKMAGFRERLGNHGSRPWIMVGADRLDYTKGIPERIRGYELMLKQHPELQAKVTYLQLAAPSRTAIDDYKHLNEELDDLVDGVNRQYRTDGWLPIHYLKCHHDYFSVLAAYRMAHAVIVSSLHDGMNLVAKEFVSARTDGDGALILSQHTGASRELTDAILVNPYDTQALADSMYAAYTMSEVERRSRMAGLRCQVEQNDVFRWGKKIFSDIIAL
jgi:trehalose-6-phosphate synthase